MQRGFRGPCCRLDAQAPLPLHHRSEENLQLPPGQGLPDARRECTRRHPGAAEWKAVEAMRVRIPFRVPMQQI